MPILVVGFDPGPVVSPGEDDTAWATAVGALRFRLGVFSFRAHDPSPSNFVLLLLILVFVQAQNFSIVLHALRISEWEEATTMRSST